MFRAALVGLATACVVLAQPAHLPPTLGVFLDFEAEPSAAVLRAMHEEVAKIMKPTGLSVKWRSLQDHRSSEAFSQIAVVRFHGSCRATSAPGERERTAEIRLASTAVTDGVIQPYSDVACEQVARIVPADSGDRQKALGKILGRVIAHEMFHSVANAAHHAARGVAKGTYSAAELVSASLDFDRASILALQKSH